MKEITLIEFLLNYNFRKPVGENGFSTSIVRIYLDNFPENWIEYGLYDFDNEENKNKRIRDSLNINLITRIVRSYYYDEDEEVFIIFLDEEVKTDNE